jgi:acetolactate synthase-1/2/3 large subunit
MKVYEAVAQGIVAEGCDKMFGLMGDANMWLWAAFCAQPGVRIYSARHEAAAVSMGDGFSRATGKVGVVTVTCGPGLTHAATPIVAAARHRTPLVIITGEVALPDRHNPQLFDQRAFSEACEARYLRLSSEEYGGEELREAFYMAQQHGCPVVFSMPLNVQSQDLKKPWSYRASCDFLPEPRHEPAADGLEPVLQALIAAERPVIIAGRGAMHAKDEIVALADRSGALLATSMLAKDLFLDHPFNIGVSGGFAAAPTERLLRQADFALAIGASLNFFTTGESDFLLGEAKIARIDIAPAPDTLGWLPGLYLQSDARAAAVALTEALEHRQVSKTGFRTASTETLLHTNFPLPEKPGDGLDARRLMRALSQAMPENAIITCGSAQFWGFPIMHFALSAGSRMEFTGDFGAIGAGLAVGIGVAAGAPERPQIVIEGDGSFLQHLQELETVVREGLQLVVIVMNDGGYGAEVYKMRAKGFDSTLAQWNSPDFVDVSRALGGDGIRLQSETEIGEALKTGLKKGGLYLIDARISPTSPTDRYLKHHFGEENKAPLLRRGLNVD